MSLLTLHQLECERDHHILFTHLNFQCNEGDIVQIKGPNGCGKTTLLRMITGLSADFQGDIKWRDKPLTDVYQTVLTQLLYIGHAPGVKKTLSPRENLHWLCGLSSCSHSPRLSENINKALEQVGLYGFEDIPCYQLSAGQQQRVALARLYLSSDLLWVLDEPFTALDSQGIGYFETLISNHAHLGGCVLLTTHHKLTIDSVKQLNLADYRPGNA